MVSEPKPMDISLFPELLRWAEEVQRSGVGRVLKRGEREIALLAPIALRSGPSKGELSQHPDEQNPTDADAILRIIGIGESAEPTDIARHELRYLAEAYTPRRR